jgi:hypothetical protein
MHSVVRRAAAGGLWLSVVAYPALAQIDRIGGPVELRSADRPIPAPTLPSGESVSSELRTFLPTSPPASDDVLKQIDKELGRTGTKSTPEVDSASPSTDRSGLGGSTLK